MAQSATKPSLEFDSQQFALLKGFLPVVHLAEDGAKMVARGVDRRPERVEQIFGKRCGIRVSLGRITAGKLDDREAAFVGSLGSLPSETVSNLDEHNLTRNVGNGNETADSRI